MHFVFCWMGMHVLIISPVMGKRRSPLGELWHFTSCADFPVHILVMCSRDVLVISEFLQVVKYHSAATTSLTSLSQTHYFGITYIRYTHIDTSTLTHPHDSFSCLLPGLLLLLPDQKSRWEHYKSSCFGWYDSSGRNSSPDVCLGIFSDSTGDYQHDQRGEVFQICGDQHLGPQTKSME